MLQMLGSITDKLGVKPELAVAVQVAVPLTAMLDGVQVKVRVWLPLATGTLVVTAGAAEKSALPAWLAVTVQVPTLPAVSVAPLKVQTLAGAALRVVVKPEVAVAVQLAVVPTVRLAGSQAKVSVCVPLPTVILLLTAAAAM